MQATPQELWKILRTTGKLPEISIPSRDLARFKKAIVMNKYREVRTSKSFGIQRYGHITFNYRPGTSPGFILVSVTLQDFYKIDDDL